MNKFFSLLLILAIFFLSEDAFASQRLGHSNDERSVEGYGEYILLETESKADGKEKAIEIAKMDAARRIGEYIEVVTLTDAHTGKIKSFIAGVSATELQVDDVKTEFQIEGEDLIASARVTVTYRESDMKASLERFMENDEIKKALSDSTKKVNDLMAQNKERASQLESLRKLKEELQATNKSSAERIEKLEEQISISRKSIIEQQGSMLNSLSELYAVVGIINKKETETPEIAEHGENDVQQKYKDYIVTLAESVKNFTKVKMTNDSFRGKIDVAVLFSWSIAIEQIEALSSAFGGEWSKSQTNGNSQYEMHVMSLNNYELQSIYTKYAIFLVVEVGGKKVEAPILLPIRGKSVSQNINDVCELGAPLDQQGYGFFLCVVKKHTLLANVSMGGILSKIYDSPNIDRFSLPSDKQYIASKYIEVREINGTPLKTIEF